MFPDQTKVLEPGINIEKPIAVRDGPNSDVLNESLYRGIARAGLPSLKSAIL